MVLEYQKNLTINEQIMSKIGLEAQICIICFIKKFADEMTHNAATEKAL